MTYRILVLGGYGNFAQRICRELSGDANSSIIVAGRNLRKAKALVAELPPGKAEASRIDLSANGWQQAIRSLKPDLVIHSCGPFQEQGYEVAECCIRAGIHYIDLADGREFVCHFQQLHDLAVKHNVVAISGASTVPALSAAVIDELLPGFSRIEHIDHGINPGNQTPRGLATVRSILSYCGKPFQQWFNGKWRTVFGWQGLVRRRYPQPMGTRWLGYCDIPDLELLVYRYPGVKSVVFRAGVELSLLHLGTWLLSWASRFGLVNNWARHAALLKTMSEWFGQQGSTRGGMHVEVSGRDHYGRSLISRWYLLADGGDGPQVPCTSAIVLARKLQRNELRQPGATACMGLFSLGEFMQALQHFDITSQVEHRYPDSFVTNNRGRKTAM